jgi:hypothetical protein
MPSPRMCAFIALAGPTAEAIFVGVPVDELLLEDGVCRVDLEMARRHLAEMEDPEERLRRVIAATDRIVRERWSLIERIASALVERGRLDAGELETLFRAKSDLGPLFRSLSLHKK